VLGFLSPCVLPLVPGYLSYVTGMTGTEQARPRRVLAGAGLFVLGFTAIFVASGALLGALGTAINTHRITLERIGGAITIAMGLVLLGVLPIFEREIRLQWRPRAGLAGAPLLGAGFGLAWTPCLTPTVSAVYTLAVTQSTAGRGALLALAYCLGLGVPFLLVAAGVGWLSAGAGVHPPPQPGDQPARRRRAHGDGRPAGHRYVGPLDERAARHRRTGHRRRGSTVSPSRTRV
jgi:cytochrome c-type biogenesis protein